MKRLIFFFILGLGFRLFCLGNKSLWLDEACSLYEAQQPISTLITEAFSYDLHPPLYSILLHYWTKMGTGEFNLRLLSAIFGFLSIIVFYKLIQPILNRGESFIALSLFTFSSPGIFFSQDMRPYSLFLFETILLSYLFLKYLSSNSKYAIVYTVIGIMSIYTHIYTSLILLVHFFYTLVCRRKILGAGVSLLIIGLCFLPWLPAITSKSYLFDGKIRIIFSHRLLEAFTGLNFYPDTLPFSIDLLLATVFVLVITYAFLKEKEIEKWHGLFLFSFLFPLLIILFYPFRIHQFNIKEIVFISPFWYILLAWSTGSFKKIFKVLVIIIWFLGNTMALLSYYSPDFAKENWREVAAYIESKEKKGEAIIFNPPYLGFPFDYYYHGGLPRGKIETGREAALLKARYNAVWLIESSSYLALPLREIRSLLDETGFKKRERFIWRGYLGDIIITKFY